MSAASSSSAEYSYQSGKVNNADSEFSSSMTTVSDHGTWSSSIDTTYPPHHQQQQQTHHQQQQLEQQTHEQTTFQQSLKPILTSHHSYNNNHIINNNNNNKLTHDDHVIDKEVGDHDDDDDDDDDEHTHHHPSTMCSCTRFTLGSAIVANGALLVTFIILLFKIYFLHEHTYSTMKLFVPPVGYQHYSRFAWTTFPVSKRDSPAIFSQLDPTPSPSNRLQRKTKEQEGTGALKKREKASIGDGSVQVMVLKHEPLMNPSKRILYTSSVYLTYLQNDFEFDSFGFCLLPGSTVNMSYYLEYQDDEILSPIQLAVMDHDYFPKWARHELPSYMYTTFDTRLNLPYHVSYQVGSLVVNPNQFDFVFYYANRNNHSTIDYGSVFFSVSIPNYLTVDRKMVKSVCDLRASDCKVPADSIVVFNVTGDAMGYSTQVKTRSAQGDFGRLMIASVPIMAMILLDVMLLIGFLLKYLCRVCSSSKVKAERRHDESAGLLTNKS